MVRAVKQTVTIQTGGKVEITSSDLPEGHQAEVIVLISHESPAPSYLTQFGSGRGAFDNPAEADRFLRGERDAWEK